jgi:hypothetical protein
MEQWRIGGIIVEGKPMFPESDLRQVRSVHHKSSTDCPRVKDGYKPPELCHDQVRKFVAVCLI